MKACSGSSMGDDCIVHPSSQNIGGFVPSYLRGIYTPMPRRDVKQKDFAFLKVILCNLCNLVNTGIF